jgi:4-hydroxy-4-methyl-2-oxoglutarate aldolase
MKIGSRKESFMALAPVLTEEELDTLRRFDTCMVANAVETFNVRLHNTGFTNASIHCMFEDAPPMVGYAATARLRSGQPPVVGSSFRDRADFWNSILEIPAPRILVLEDKDSPPGRGAFVGDMHSAILKALGCIGYVTNGAVRELPSVRTSGIQLFAGSVAVSHAYAPFSMSALPSLWEGWRFVPENCCTAIVTAYSQSQRRLRRRFPRLRRKYKAPSRTSSTFAGPARFQWRSLARL